jgi:asparagine synthase (glutamine-hydrolysing)
VAGICGIVDRGGDSDGAIKLSRMLAQMRRSLDGRASQHSDETRGCVMGCVTRGDGPTAASELVFESEGLLAVMDGELYDIDDLRAGLARFGYACRTDSHAELLLQLYRYGGRSQLAQVHGSFVAAVWDSARSTLVLVNDRFGTRPLYYVALPSRLLFASNIKPLLADRDVSRAPDRVGLAQFFTHGYYLRDNTSLQAVRVLPAAAWWEYSADTGQLSTEQYWNPRDVPETVSQDRPELLDRIDAAFVNAVRRRTQGATGLGLALSGGLDARTILGVMDHPSAGLQSVCLGMEGSQDHRIAERLASIAPCRHHHHVLDWRFLEDFEEHLERMVQLTDGQYLSQCIVMPTLGLYRELGIRVLLRGHAGELMHMSKAYNYSLDHSALALQNAQDLEDWLAAHLPAYLTKGVSHRLFASMSNGEMAQLARQSLREDLAETAGAGAPVQQVWRLFLTQRLRREMVLSLMKFRSVVEPRLPYLDNELVPLLLAAPVELKLSDTIQSHILGRHCPAFLNVVNVNTGATLRAGACRNHVAGLRRRVLAKLGVRGYQPYERLGLWLRRELAGTVKEILLGARCLDRGIFDPDGVRWVVSRHLAGANHTFLLLAMMVFEAGQRYLLDDDPLTDSPTAVHANQGAGRTTVAARS